MHDTLLKEKIVPLIGEEMLHTAYYSFRMVDLQINK